MATVYTDYPIGQSSRPRLSALLSLPLSLCLSLPLSLSFFHCLPTNWVRSWAFKLLAANDGQWAVHKFSAWAGVVALPYASRLVSPVNVSACCPSLSPPPSLSIVHARRIRVCTRAPITDNCTHQLNEPRGHWTNWAMAQHSAPCPDNKPTGCKFLHISLPLPLPHPNCH